jgi:WD40 repeat protein
MKFSLFKYSIIFSICWVAGCNDTTTTVQPPQNDEFDFTVFNANVSFVKSVALNENKNLYAWCGRTNEVKVSGKAPFLSHIGSVNAVDFNNDGSLLLSGSNDNNIKLWNVETGELLKTFSEHVTQTKDVVFTSDGKNAVSAENNYIVYWRNVVEGHIGKKPFYGHTGTVNSIDMNQDMSKIVSGSRDGTIKIWDVESGQMLQSINAHPYGVSDVEFNKSGNNIVSCGRDSSINLWDADSYQLIKNIKTNFRVNSVSFHHSGNYLAVCGNDTSVFIYSVSDLSIIKTLNGHTSSILDVKFSKSNNTVISGGVDDKVFVWYNVFSEN